MLQRAGVGHVGGVQRCFVVVQLADDVVARIDSRPSQQGIGLRLHLALALDNAAALLVPTRGGRVLERNVGAGHGLFDLQEQRIACRLILRAVTEQQDDVVTQADRAGADHLECKVDGNIAIEQFLMLGRESTAIIAQRSFQ